MENETNWPAFLECCEMQEVALRTIREALIAGASDDTLREARMNWYRLEYKKIRLAANATSA